MRHILNLGNNALEFVTCIKILRVYFDYKLIEQTYYNNYNNLADNCKQRLNIIKSLTYNNWKLIKASYYKSIKRFEPKLIMHLCNSAKPRI